MALQLKELSFFNERKTAIAPTQEDWQCLFDVFSYSNDPFIDIIIPVHKGFEETSRCLYSVLTEKQITPFRVIVINDNSPEKEITLLLEELESKNLIELYNNKQNLGFVKSCNFGMMLHQDRDVVLLNSDTEVYNDWLDRIVNLIKELPNAGTATPLSNNAEICNYPYFCEEFPGSFECGDKQLDKFCSISNQGQHIVIPTGVGFCMYITRECLNKVGYFDEKSFGLGYGEENDLCRRIQKAGYNNILVPNVFVRHYGAKSFGASKLERISKAIKKVNRLHREYNGVVSAFVQEDPVKPLRQNIDFARIHHLKTNNIMIVSHNLGGGTEKHITELTEVYTKANINVFFCRPKSPTEITISCPSKGIEKNFDPFSLETDLIKFIETLNLLNIEHIHIHSLVGLANYAPDFFSEVAERSAIKMDLTIHDYYPVCPTINLIDQTNLYCGEPEINQCEKCIKHIDKVNNKQTIWMWRRSYHFLMLAANNIFVPNVDVKDRLLKFWPDLINITVLPHEKIKNSISQKSETHNHKSGDYKYKIGLIGALGIHKGSILLEECAKYALDNNIAIDFIVFGYTDRDSDLNKLENVTITGKYEEHELQTLLNENEVDVLWFSSIWPETYSYTLTQAFESGITSVAFDFGAVAKRINELGIGETLPITSMLHIEELTSNLHALAKKYHGFKNNKLIFEINNDIISYL